MGEACKGLVIDKSSPVCWDVAVNILVMLEYKLANPFLKPAKFAGGPSTSRSGKPSAYRSRFTGVDTALERIREKREAMIKQREKELAAQSKAKAQSAPPPTPLQTMQANFNSFAKNYAGRNNPAANPPVTVATSPAGQPPMPLTAKRASNGNAKELAVVDQYAVLPDQARAEMTGMHLKALRSKQPWLARQINRWGPSVLGYFGLLRPQPNLQARRPVNAYADPRTRLGDLSMHSQWAQQLNRMRQY